jgi:thiosulfate reductase cytochrome b subunit
MSTRHHLQRSQCVHPLAIRITHWLNAIAVFIMVASGWRIYNSSPLFGFHFPNGITLGGWLAGALQWHFAAMWLLVFNGIVYLSFNTFSGRWRRQFFPLSLRQVFVDFLAALKGKLSHDDPAHYNAVQKAAYLFVVLDLIVIVLSGLVLWKSVQFSFLRELMGGYEVARRVHFVGMAALVGFFIVHVAMVALVPRTFVAMIRGR